MTKTKTYPTLTERHGISHFIKAMHESSIFYFDNILCRCVGFVDTGRGMVRIIAVNANHFDDKFRICLPGI